MPKQLYAKVRKYASTNDIMYDEAEALNKLHDCIYDALTIDDLNNQEDNYVSSEFTINIAGTSIAFSVGGPQTEGLYQFIENIASENMYGKDALGRFISWDATDEPEVDNNPPFESNLEVMDEYIEMSEEFFENGIDDTEEDE